MGLSPNIPGLRLLLVVALALVATATFAIGAVALMGPAGPLAPAIEGPSPRPAVQNTPPLATTPNVPAQAPIQGTDATDDPPGRRTADPIETDAPKPAPSPTATPAPTPDYWQDGKRRLRLIPVATLTPTATPDKIDTKSNARGARSSTEPPASSVPPQNPADPTPQFQSDSGNAMSLPGGVLLVLDADWGKVEIDEFFAANEIKPSQVTEFELLPNTFLVETPPGLESLELANSLAGQAGVVAASPNWQREITTK